MELSLEIKGAREIEEMLKTLEAKVARRVVGKALRKGAAVVRRQQIQKAITVIGGAMGTNIAGSIVVKSLKQRQRQVYRVTSMISPSNESLIYKNRNGKRYYIPTAIEYGHAFPGRGGTGEKDVSPIPFMRPAMEESAANAANAVIEELRNGIYKEAKI